MARDDYMIEMSKFATEEMNRNVNLGNDYIFKWIQKIKTIPCNKIN